MPSFSGQLSNSVSLWHAGIVKLDRHRDCRCIDTENNMSETERLSCWHTTTLQLYWDIPGIIRNSCLLITYPIMSPSQPGLLYSLLLSPFPRSINTSYQRMSDTRHHNSFVHALIKIPKLVQTLEVLQGWDMQQTQPCWSHLAGVRDGSFDYPCPSSMTPQVWFRLCSKHFLFSGLIFQSTYPISISTRLNYIDTATIECKL